MHCRLPLLLVALTMFSHARAWPSLADPSRDPERPGRKDAALIIAVEDYLFVDDVPGARTNATDWDRWFEARGVPVARVFMLSNEDAVRESILRQAEELAAEVPAGGTVWVIYIGHGAPSRDGLDGMLVGADAQQKVESLYARSVRQTELLTALKGKQRETVLILDACFSGKTAKERPLVPGLQPLVPTTLKAGPRVTVLSAGAGHEFAGPLPGLARPAFSYLLLGALHGWREADGDADGAITLEEAVGYSRGALRRLVTDRKQTPGILGPLAGLKAARVSADGPNLREVGPPTEALPFNEHRDVGTSRVGGPSAPSWPAAPQTDPPQEVQGPSPAALVAQEMAAAVCACRNLACAQKVSIEYAEQLMRFKGMPGSRADIEIIKREGEKTSACMKAIAMDKIHIIEPDGPVMREPHAWQGHYVCSKRTFSLNIDIWNWEEDNDIQGIVTFRGGSMKSDGSFHVAGSYSAQDRKLTLKKGRWLQQIKGHPAFDISGTLSMDGQSYNGRVLDKKCGAFELTRSDDPEERAISMMEALGELVDRHEGNCDRMGDALQNFMDGHVYTIRDIKAFSERQTAKQKKASEKKYRERAQKAGEKMMGGVMKCMTNEKVKAAMGKMKM